MNPLVSSLTRPPQPRPRRHRHRHHRQVNRQNLSHQIQKVTGVKRRRNTALHTETSGEKNGESCVQRTEDSVWELGGEHCIKI